MTDVCTRLNIERIKSIAQQLNVSVAQINERAGLSTGYLYRHADHPVSTATIDSIHNCITTIMGERGMPVSDDLWNSLVIQKEMVDG